MLHETKKIKNKRKEEQINEAQRVELIHLSKSRSTSNVYSFVDFTKDSKKCFQIFCVIYIYRNIYVRNRESSAFSTVKYQKGIEIVIYDVIMNSTMT